MATCKACGEEVFIGSWPYCPHGMVREVNSKRFDDIVVWQSDSDPDKYSFPGQSAEAVPDGYHKIAIRNLREADQFVTRFNNLEREKAESDLHLRHTLDDAGIKDRRAEEDARGWTMRADGSKFYVKGNSRAEALRRAVREWADRRREDRRKRTANPNFHINILSYDSGNRNSYSGEETGWRERKS